MADVSTQGISAEKLSKPTCCKILASILRQMLSWWTKNSLHSINIGDIVTKVVSLCSVYRVPFYESNFTFLASFPTKLAYLSMLVILEVVCTKRACSNRQSVAGTMLAMEE